MKVDTSRLKKGTSDVPTECQTLIDKLRSCTMDELLIELNQIDSWTFGKSELYHWIEILDIFDGILEDATKQIGNDWFLACDERFPPKKRQLLLAILNFTTLLIEHSFSRHLYNSVEHLTQLLSSTNMEIVLGVLNLLYMFSKRSNFIPRLNCAKRNALLARLTYIAESWGGKEHGYGLAECCYRTMKITDSFPKFYYEYYDSDGKLKSIEQDEFSSFIGITNPSEIAYLMCCRIPVPLDDDQKMLIFTRVRLSLSFHDYETRLQFVLARLQALSVLVYSNSLQENINTLLYPGFLEELVELLEMREPNLVEIRAAALRTLTSIIHLDRNPHFPKKPGSRLLMIIDVTGAASYHGFLPTLVRTCIQHLTTASADRSSSKLPPFASATMSSMAIAAANEEQAANAAAAQHFPLALATALFSFLYHLASYDSGGEALVACGMMESLLRVINWPGRELEHITFVTRAVRVIDLITNIEMQSFQNHGGLKSFIGRLEMEVNLCREEQPAELVASYLDRSPDSSFLVSEDTNMYEGQTTPATSAATTSSGASFSQHLLPSVQQTQSQGSTGAKNQTRSCLPQRAALLKSMLNFLKKAIQDAAFSESIRRVMESSLPLSLRHIISNAEYYGPSLFLLATDVVTVYVFQEPSLLYSLQDSGLTDVVLQALLKKDVPPTREVLGSLPNVFSALCMNSRGLAAFVQYKPFDRLFEVLLSPVYLQAMRRRRSSDPMGDTASNLGNAMDELMRHQPSLKTEATKAIIRLLEELVKLGTDEKYICWRAQSNKNDDNNFNNGSNGSSSGSTGSTGHHHHHHANSAGVVGGNVVGGGSSNNGRQSIHVRVLHVNNPLTRGGSSNHGPDIISDSVDAVVRNSVNENVGGNGGGENNAGSSDEDDDDEEEASTSSHHNQRDVTSALNCSREAGAQGAAAATNERTPIPLIDYILNVMKFVDAILSNNSTDDHCREFVTQGGLQPLLRILSLPNLPVDSPITASAQAVAAVCKSILSLAHEPMVLQVSLEQLAVVVDQLEPLQSHWDRSQGSVLLRELANCKNIEAAFSNASETPLLHAMGAVHGYVVMLVHVCRTGQSEIRNLLIDRWGQNTKYGQKLLYKLVQLYTALVWESTLLLALCTDDIIPVGCDFGKEDLDKLPKEKATTSETAAAPATQPPTAAEGEAATTATEATPPPTTASADVTSAAAAAAAAAGNPDPMDESTEATRSTSATSGTTTTANAAAAAGTSQRRIIATPSQLRYIKSLLGASSRLGRALAELFGLLVKLCVGNRIRMRHPQNVTTNYMSSSSRDIARVLSYILVDGLSHDQLPPSPIPKLKQTFLICSIGFTSPMLFDEKRFAYHLMLHKFCEEGGLQAFFEMFEFALNSEQPKNSVAAATDTATDGTDVDMSDAAKDETSAEQSPQPPPPPPPQMPFAVNKSDDAKLTSSIAMSSIIALRVPRETPTIGDEHGEFPTGSGEFLDAWLMLLEKMVNPKAILEAPHVIALKSLRNKPEFDTVSYLINVHRLAFQTVTKIWSYKPIRTYGPRMTESMLTIIKHIYKGDPILRERYNKKLAEQASSSAAAQGATDKSSIATKYGSGFQRTATNQFDNDTARILARNRLSENVAATPPSAPSVSASGVTAPNAAAAAAATAPLNEAHLNQLMDMGFLQEHCREALYYTASVEQATEYLLENTFAGGSSSANAGTGTSASTTAATAAATAAAGTTASNAERLAFRAQLHLAAAGNTIDSEDDDDVDNLDAEMVVLMGQQKLTGSETVKRNRRGMRSTQIVLPNDPPLSEQLLYDFSEEAVRTSLYLIDQVPDAVFKGTELLAILFKRDDIKWKMLATIIGTMIECADQLYSMLCDGTTPIEEIFFGAVGCKFAVRLHIFCLFLEGQYPDLRTPTILSMKEFKLMPELIRLLNETEAVLTSKAGKCPYTPKWLTQMILLIDLYEKVVILTRRRNEMHRITTQIWKWYDVASGKWNAYSVSNNKIINDAYWAGESSVRVSVGRHRYTINFNCMSQVNEETGNHRPIVLGLLSSFKRMPERTTSASLSYIFGGDNEDNDNESGGGGASSGVDGATTIGTDGGGDVPEKVTLAADKPINVNPSTATAVPVNLLGENELDKTTAAALSEMRQNHLTNNFRTYYTESMMRNAHAQPPIITPEDVKLLGLEEFSTETIVGTCVRLMSPNILVDRDSLHALLKLCVRLTTKYENAEVFAREGGIKLLLEMKQTCGYNGFSTLANLLIRHTLEEPQTLATAMEKVIAARTLQTIPPGYRDLIFMLRRMSSAVARDPDVFKQVARSMLRIDVNALRRGVFSEDYRLIMKSTTSPSQKRHPEKPNEASMPVKVVYDLLQALIVPITTTNQTQSSDEKSSAASTSTSGTNKPANQRGGGSTSNAATSSFCLLPNSDDFIEEPLLPGGHLSIPAPIRHHLTLDTIRHAPASAIGEHPLIGGTSDSSVHRSVTSAGTVNNDRTRDLVVGGGNSASDGGKPSSVDVWNISCSKSDNDKPLLPKSTILKALAEAVRSYQSVGVIIADYTYQPQPNTLIRKPQPALAFILDYLLPSTDQNPDRECSSGARMLIAALSAATDSQITQYTVVSEVRAAILRALAWPEIPEKHQQLQLLTALIPTMIENCPPDNPALMRLHPHQPRRNDIFNIMVRKGLITDLANITQSLDLSSPHTVLTIGTALKSLEQLLRMSNQPITPISLQLNSNKNRSGSNENDNSNATAPNDVSSGRTNDSTAAAAAAATVGTATQASHHHHHHHHHHNPHRRQILTRRPPSTTTSSSLVAGSTSLVGCTLAANVPDGDDVDDDDDDEDDEDDVMLVQEANALLAQTHAEDEEIDAAEASDTVASSLNVEAAEESGREDNVVSAETIRLTAENIFNENDLNLVSVPTETLVTRVEELMEHFIDREQLIDEQQQGPQPRSSISSGAATRGSISASVVTAGSSGSTGGSMQPIELADERYILEEDDTSSDSESNGSEENDEEREEEMDDDENEDEAEDRSDLEVDEETRQFIDMYDHVYGRHLSPSIPELERDSEDILMIQYADNGRDVGAAAANGNSVGVSVNVSNNIMGDDNDAPDAASNNAMPSGSGISRVTVSGGGSSGANANDGTNGPSRFLLHADFPNIFEANNISRHDESVSGNGDTSNESAAPGSPNASNVRIGGLHISTGNARSSVVGGGSGGGGGAGGSSSQNQTNSLSQLIQFRTQRNSNRHRRCAYLNLNGRNSNPPAILQRLLGPSVAQNVNIGLGQVIANANGSASFRDATRVVVMDNGFGIFSNAGEPSIDLVDQAGYLFGRSLAATLNSTPSPLHWWLEEAKVLGLESQADVCLTVCNDLIPDLERQRSLELSKTRSKRKKKSTGESGTSASATGSQKQQKSTNVDGGAQSASGGGGSSNVPTASSPATRTNTTVDGTEASVTIGDDTQSNDDDIADAEHNDFVNSHVGSHVVVGSHVRLDGRRTIAQIVNDNEALFEAAGEGEAAGEEPYDSEDDDESDNSEPADDSEDSRSHDTEEDEHREYSEERDRIDRHNSREDEHHIASPPTGRRRAADATLQPVDQEPEDANTREEITESDDGSASDSGRSIASSVSTERFFQQQQQQQQQTVANATTTEVAQDELLSYDELCNGNADVGAIESTESALPLPPIDNLQPLAIGLEQPSAESILTPTTSSSASVAGVAATEPTTGTSESSYDEVEQILRAIKGEFKEQDIIVIDGDNTDNDVINVYSSNEECEQDDKDENDEDEDDDDEDDDENDGENVEEGGDELGQEAKRQRLNQSPPSREPDTSESAESSAVVWMPAQPPSWQPRRRLLRGRRAIRGNRGSSNQLQNIVADDDDDIGEDQAIAIADPTALAQSVNIESIENATNAVAPSSTANSSSTANAATPSTASGEASQIPDGIDPSFLAALPEEMRDEVIAEHLRIQRMQERTRMQQQAAVQNEQTVVEVNPEFLAALPPNIQEEVLAQQRIEQQRLAAAAANPNDPVDAAAFFQNLQPSLRQAILTDMEDSQISVLPPELAAEAQNLRRDWENRNRQIMQEQINQIGGAGSGNVGTSPSFSSVLRYRSRLPEPIFSAHNLQRMRWSNWGISPNSGGLGGDGAGGLISSAGRDLVSSGSNILADLRMEQQGRPLLDHESLASLLILLFIEANKVCTLRFHRVIRNLCYHVPTRDWIIRTILSIIARSNVQAKANDPQQTTSNRPHWLNIRLDAALGNRNNIFIIQKKRTMDTSSEDDDSDSDDIANAILNKYSIQIHPQAAQIVCRHALDLLIPLAKNFPANFLPIKKKGSSSGGAGGSSASATNKNDNNQPSTSGVKTDAEQLETSTDFWDILLRLEMKAQKRKSSTDAGAAASATTSRPQTFDEIEINSFAESPFGQLISMLSYDIILKCSLLTDKLLRLLSSISIGLPDAVHQSQMVEASTSASANASTSNAAGADAAENAANTLSAETRAHQQPQSNSASVSTSTTAANASTIANHMKPVPVQLDEKCLPESQDSLRLAIEVLTSKSCSEEGLEDATSLLLNLSQCSNVTRTFILNFLIDGAKYLAGIVQSQINDLIVDLRQLNQRNRSESGSTTLTHDHLIESALPSSQPSTSRTSSTSSAAAAASAAATAGGPGTSKGILQDRFTKETVVITSTSKQKTRCELQLPSMVPLISKTASQSFFLRILKVVIQIRESAKETMAKETTTATTESTTTNSSATTDTPQAANATAATDSAATTAAVPPTPTSDATTTQTSNSAFYNVAAVASTSSSATTAAGTNNLAKPSGGSASKKIVLDSIELQPLSETLQLDHLWNTLSDCLVELEENADHHAVLVLQPAVEAFFLVHASSTTVSSATNASTNATVRASSIQPGGDPQASTNNITASANGTAAAATAQRNDNDNEMQVETVADTDSTASASAAATVSDRGASAPVSPISLFDLPNNDIETDDNESQSVANAGSDATATTEATGNHLPNQASILATAHAAQISSDQKKFLQFAEKHRTVLNQILRQSTVHLSDGPFAVLVDHTRILDFDVKRRYFRTELERMDEGIRREELAVHVHRVTVFEDSFRELYRRNPEEWKNRFYIVFEDEEGQDAGGLLREWYVIISREIFNPMYALFTVSPGDRVTYMINPSSHANSNHLFYFKFVGRVIAKAIYDNKLLECYFTRSFYKHILGIEVNTQDMENEDYEFYKGLVYLMENHVSALGYEQTFSLEVQEFGVTEVRDLIPNGRNIVVTDENKFSYIHMVCQLKMSGSIKQQLNAFLEGFYDIIPKRLISIFNEQELELLISGLPNVDIEDLKANTEYHKYQANSIQIQWFWRALRSFDQADRAKFLQFVTGTSKVPLQGFGALEGMNGVQKFQIHRDDRSTERLPSAHTCFNQLDLPVYKTYDKLRSSLLKAIHECSEGFGFA